MSRRKRHAPRAKPQVQQPKPKVQIHLEHGPSERVMRKAERLTQETQDLNDYARQIELIGRSAQRTYSLDEVRSMFTLPQTNGAPPEARERFNMAFDAAGGFNGVMHALNKHTHDLGQGGFNTFMGYGALMSVAQNGMIRACVQTVADDVTKKWISVIGGEEDDTERVEGLTDLLKQYRLQSVFHDAVAMVGYYGGAFIFIDTGAPEEDLSLPLAVCEGSAELNKETELSFRVVDPCNVSPCEYNCDNPLAADYMKPRMWYVLGKRVHASRLLALYDNEPPTLLKPAYNFLGIPRAQILWDYVMHWNEARVYSNDLLKKISLLVLKTDTDSIFAMQDGIQMFDLKVAALQKFRDNNSIYVCDKEREDVTNVQTSLAGATDIVRQSLEMVAAINRTPAVKLLGISPSGFNATGESDITNYYDHIRAQQELYRRHIERCLNVIQVVHYGDIDQTVTFDFVELSADNDTTKSMTALNRLQMLVTAQQNQVLSAQEVRDALRADKLFNLDFIGEEAPAEDEHDTLGLEELDLPQLQLHAQKAEGGGELSQASEVDESDGFSDLGEGGGESESKQTTQSGPAYRAKRWYSEGHGEAHTANSERIRKGLQERGYQDRR